MIGIARVRDLITRGPKFVLPVPTTQSVVPKEPNREMSVSGALRERNAHGRFLSMMVATGVLVAACGGGGDGDPAANAQVTPTQTTNTNSAPTITGSAPGTVSQDAAYSFTPSASDADNDTLTFSVTNLPPWANFDPSNGSISGTPGAANLGSYPNIRISVTDGTATASLASFSITVVAVGTGSATLSWTPPTQNTDGSPLTDLDGYRIYWGKTAGAYTDSATLDNEGVTTYVVDGLTPGTWFFTTTAFNSLGVESSYSNVATKTIPSL